MHGPLATPLERRILDRLGYGACPGDVETLRGQGIDTYIAQQLEPDTIEENPVLEALLTECETLEMDPDEAHAVEQEWFYDRAVAPALNVLFKFPRTYPLQEFATNRQRTEPVCGAAGRL